MEERSESPPVSVAAEPPPPPEFDMFRHIVLKMIEDGTNLPEGDHQIAELKSEKGMDRIFCVNRAYEGIMEQTVGVAKHYYPLVSFWVRHYNDLPPESWAVRVLWIDVNPAPIGVGMSEQEATQLRAEVEKMAKTDAEGRSWYPMPVAIDGFTEEILTHCNFVPYLFEDKVQCDPVERAIPGVFIVPFEGWTHDCAEWRNFVEKLRLARAQTKRLVNSLGGITTRQLLEEEVNQTLAYSLGDGREVLRAMMPHTSFTAENPNVQFSYAEEFFFGKDPEALEREKEVATRMKAFAELPVEKQNTLNTLAAAAMNAQRAAIDQFLTPGERDLFEGAIESMRLGSETINYTGDTNKPVQLDEHGKELMGEFRTKLYALNEKKPTKETINEARECLQTLKNYNQKLLEEGENRALRRLASVFISHDTPQLLLEYATALETGGQSAFLEVAQKKMLPLLEDVKQERHDRLLKATHTDKCVSTADLPPVAVETPPPVDDAECTPPGPV